MDVGGTLIKGTRGTFGLPRPPTKPQDVVLLPGVFEKLEELRAAGHQLAIATNQTSVAHGEITLKEAELLIKNVVKKVGGVEAWRISPYAPRAKKKIDGRPNPYARDDPSRKPHPGMILELMQELHCSPKETLMAGNRPGDRKAAEQAGVFYVDAKKFFKDEYS